MTTAGLRQRGQGAAGNGVAARERIATAFRERVRANGIRAVVMSDLARELSMSKKTLYQHFGSKDALVREIVEIWVTRLREQARRDDAPVQDAQELVRWWTEFWVKEQTDYCFQFWCDLEADHPETWKLLWDVLKQGVPSQVSVTDWLRPGISPQVAASLYYEIIAFYNDPAICAKLGFSRREAVMSACEIWIQGALRPPVDLNDGIEPDPDR